MVPLTSRAKPNLVTVMFPDTALSFEMPAGTTLGELADYLADLREVQGGEPPVTVDVQVVC